MQYAAYRESVGCVTLEIDAQPRLGDTVLRNLNYITKDVPRILLVLVAGDADSM